MSEPLHTRGHALLVGLGRSGASAARHLVGRGWRIAATDSRKTPPGLEELRVLQPDAPASVGRFDQALLEGAALVVVSPGVSLAEPILEEARRRGLPIVGDIELFARVANAPTVGITGTNGKSTVTSLVGEMARAAGRRVAVGGNLGTPALDLWSDPPPELYVLEISSYQLESTASLRLRAAAVLNLTPDHMDRYADMAAYGAAKARIFANSDVAIVNADDAWTTSMPRPGQPVRRFSVKPGVDAEYALLEHDGRVWLARCGERLMRVDEMRIAGLHNAANALAAIALGDAAGLPTEAMLRALREFHGLAHRSQWIAEIRGVRYVDDSKGTNVGATLAAVEGMPGTLVVIAGGDGKGQDFAPLADAFRGKVRHAVLIGRAAPVIEVALAGVCPTERCGSLEEAVRAAARVARPGDVVLLSPACASLDMFRDYAHRGQVFAAAVRSLAA